MPRTFSCRALIVTFTLFLASLSLSQAQNSTPAAFTLQQVLSAPFPSELRSAPALGRISWLSNAEGRRNLWIADLAQGKYTAHQLTHYTDDDGVDLGDVAWSSDAQQIAYVRGGDFEAPSKPAANPALLPEGIDQNIWLVSLKAGAASEPVKIAAGRAPLFTRNGDALIYLSNGQIWTIKIALPSKSTKAKPEQAANEQPKPEQLLHTRGNIGSLRLSPDGSRLAFVSRRGDHSFIGVYDLQAKSLLYLDPSTDDDMAPIWSPESDRIAYIRTSTGNDDYEFAPSRSGYSL